MTYSKFRLLVEAHLSIGERISGFIAKHIEQPASRHSKPASVKILPNPSRSACCLTRPDPGTIIALLRFLATFFPSTIFDAALRSSIRAFVQEPIKILSSTISSMLVPGSRPMYLSALRQLSRFALSSKSSGAGTTPVIGTTSWGDVPQLTVGTMSAALMSTSSSYRAPRSDLSVSQYFVAFLHSGLSSFGESGLNHNVSLDEREISRIRDSLEGQTTFMPKTASRLVLRSIADLMMHSENVGTVSPTCSSSIRSYLSRAQSSLLVHQLRWTCCTAREHASATRLGEKADMPGHAIIMARTTSPMKALQWTTRCMRKSYD